MFLVTYAHEIIKRLKPGDYFIDGKIVSLKRSSYVSIVTEAGSVFSAHGKPWGYTVFKKLKKKRKSKQ
jgi:hypothetical protein